jgi:tRNA (guanine37-N1)-methyltransferase
MLRIDFVTLFPEMILPALEHSIMRRARESGLVAFGAVNPRDFATDRHKTVDDKPFGGGPGMVMKVDLVAQALDQVRQPHAAVVLTDPAAPTFTQHDAQALAGKGQVVFLCGHYEGIDHRARTILATHVFSIGDYVLTGGELPALVMTDAIVRLLRGALGSAESLEADSHAEGLLGYPQYTKPLEFRGGVVPDVLRSGDHGAVERWRRREALKMTRDLRPDLFCRAKLEKGDLDLLSS